MEMRIVGCIFLIIIYVVGKMKKYQIIYADPPWQSEKGWFNNKAWKKTRFENHYPTMSLEDICNLPVESITEKNAHLYLWTTSRNLLKGDAWRVVSSWGFRPINVITWCKTQFGIGNYFQNNTEHLIFGVKGQMSTLDTGGYGTYFIHKRLKHSQKPPIVKNWIVKWSGGLPRIELFARQKTEGWDVWGNEVKSDIKLI